MKVSDGWGMVKYRAQTSRHANRPMEVCVYANGMVKVTGRATNKQLELLFEQVLKNGIPTSGGSTQQ
jgi:hypothetical protein